jgi:hypothetical protein
VKHARHPAVERLEVEEARAALEPVALHDDAIPEALVHPEVVAEFVEVEFADRGDAAHQHEGEPWHAD